MCTVKIQQQNKITLSIFQSNSFPDLMVHHWFLSSIHSIYHLMTTLSTTKTLQSTQSQHIPFQINLKLSINLAISPLVVCQMTDGFVLFVSIFSKMLLKLHAAIIYFVSIVSDRQDNARFATSVLLANLSQIFLSDVLSWNYQ